MSFLHHLAATAACSWVLVTLLSSCSGRAGDACRNSTDCASGLACVGPDDGVSCGIAPTQGCETDLSCSGGLVCNAVVDQCSVSGIGSACGAPCTATSCGSGLRCNAKGSCEPIPCNEGFACTVIQTCNPSLAQAQIVYESSQGCEPIPCDGDADCPATTACVNSICQTHAGTCEMQTVVP